jgi:hypothetical protein
MTSKTSQAHQRLLEAPGEKVVVEEGVRGLRTSTESLESIP